MRKRKGHVDSGLISSCAYTCFLLVCSVTLVQLVMFWYPFYDFLGLIPYENIADTFLASRCRIERIKLNDSDTSDPRRSMEVCGVACALMHVTVALTKEVGNA